MSSEVTNSLPLYQSFFFSPGMSNPCANWDSFKSTAKELTTPLSDRAADFSIQDDKGSWSALAERTALFILKIVIFPWGIYELTRYCVQRIVMIPLYPAQSGIVKFIFARILGLASIDAKSSDHRRVWAVGVLQEKGFIVKHVSLEKNGVRYSGLMMGRKETMNNGKWVLQATGNLEPIESSAELFATTYSVCGFNTLMINGPGVCRSEGEADPKSMGEAQVLGLSFLEKAVQATKIAISGRSLGGAATSQAILQHTFKKDVKYMAMRQMTFDRSSNICRKIVETAVPSLAGFAESLVTWSGCEMDSVAASKKLRDLGIKEVIVQASNKTIPWGAIPKVEDFESDGVILADASLGRALVKEGITQNKAFHCLKDAGHMDGISAAQAELMMM